MFEHPKESQSAHEDWVEELVRLLNGALIAGKELIVVEFDDALQNLMDDTGQERPNE